MAVQELTVQELTGSCQLAGRQVQICQQTTAIFLLPTYNLSIANIDLKYITKQCRSSLKPRQRQKQFATAKSDRVWVETVVVLTSKRHRQSPIVAVNVYAPSLINVIDSTRARRRRVLYLPASPLHIVPASWMQRT